MDKDKRSNSHPQNKKTNCKTEGLKELSKVHWS